VAVSAQDHDRVMASLSHVPQIVSWALLAAARADPATRNSLRLAGPGFADMTRLARSPRRLWREILGDNRREVAAALARFSRALRATGREAGARPSRDRRLRRGGVSG
jgi:prephenate dehydrogenase